MMRSKTTAGILTLASCFLFSSMAWSAEITPSSPPKQRLNKINSLAQQGARKVPQGYKSNYEKQKKKLDGAREIFEQAKALMSPDLKGLPNAEGALRYYEELKTGVELGSLQLECLKHYEKVEQAHKNGQLAQKEWLDGLDKAISALEAQAGEAGKSAVSSWTRTRTQAQEKNDQLLKSNARQAQAFLDKETKEEMQATYGRLVKAHQEMKDLAKAGKPVPQELLGQVEKDASTVAEKSNAKAPAYWGGLKTGYEIHNAFLQLAEKPTAAAEALQGELVGKGKSKGKKFNYTVKAKADWCYAAIERWKDETGSEKAELKWNYGKSYRDVQEFRIRKKDLAPWGPISGFCTQKAAKVTRTGSLKFAGSGNAMNYAVVGWPREKLPEVVMTDVVSILVDPCDPQVWFTLWTHPVPGSFSYSDSEPVIWTHRGDSHKEVLTASGINGMSGLKRMQTTAPDKRSFAKSEWTFRGCYPKGLGYNPLGIKYETCMHKIEKKFIPKFAAAEKAKKKALTKAAIEKAEKKLKQLRAAKASEEDKKCGPTRKKITNAMNKTYTKIVDWHAKNSIETGLKVMQIVRDRKEGKTSP